MRSDRSFANPRCLLQDWEAGDGPFYTLRLNALGNVTVRAVASRGDLPDSTITTCTYSINPPNPLPCSAVGGLLLASRLRPRLVRHAPLLLLTVLFAATSMGAPAWTSERAPIYGPETLLRDDIVLSDPLGLQDNKDWDGWNPYSGIICLNGDG